MPNLNLEISHLRRLYLESALTPTVLVQQLHARMDGDDPYHIWITRLTLEQLLAYARALEGRDPASLPLYGIPFAIKDNIDLAGVPTTVACPEYAYTPPQSATVVQRLIDAGAIPIGKTNLDQFATGLNGTRSPYGACRNSFNPDYISGGSSSGSAVATALGLVSFALGTDTAGSGRVPAAFNNLVGLKPTRGLLSTAGVVPACRSLDCVSVFALSVADTQAVLEVAAGFDATDPYSRHASPARALPASGFRFGVPHPAQLEYFGNREYAQLFDAAVQQLQALGGERVDIDFAPFLQAARLLYEGPWLSERTVAIRDFIERQPQALLPVTRAIIEEGHEFSAMDTFSGMYRLAGLRRHIEPILASVDVIVTPTAGTHYRIADLEADPLRPNSNLGYYSNFINLLDLSAIALPAAFTSKGLPFGILFFADAFREQALLALGARFERAVHLPLGVTGHPYSPVAASTELPSGYAAVAVCGAHLSGLPLNHQLTSRGGFLLEATRTAPQYKFYALPGGPPFRPGLVRVNEGGTGIHVEVWALPLEHYGSFVAGIPAPLGIGSVILANGKTVQGFVCEAYALAGARDISAHGGWREYLKSQN